MKIGIIGAMEVEVKTLIEAMEETSVRTIARMEFHEGTLYGKEAVIVRSGIAKVNAAVCTQILCDTYHVTHIINTGVAGSLNNDINIGDIVVSKDCRYHDVDVEVFGYQHGEVPQMGIVSFPADETMIEQAVTAVHEAAPDVRAFVGTVVSGDQFIREHAVKERIKEQVGGDCCEMEGTAIAQTAWLNHIPFVVIRAISDKADEQTTVSYDEFEALAAVHCAKIVKHMIETIA